jgi:hypothetical protein
VPIRRRKEYRCSLAPVIRSWFRFSTALGWAIIGSIGVLQLAVRLHHDVGFLTLRPTVGREE